MSCNDPSIPKYLHTNNREHQANNRFKFYHKLYRIKKTGNPIEIPAGIITAISCKWSKLIKKKHILIIEPSLGDGYDYIHVNRLKKYRRISTLSNNNDAQYWGQHILTCKITHTPNPCDYSHCEILVHHEIKRNNKIFMEVTYDYDSWIKKTALLKKRKGKFWRSLKSDFRLDMINIINYSSKFNFRPISTFVLVTTMLTKDHFESNIDF